MSKIVKGEYGELPFGIVEQSDILTSGDFDALKALAPELKETFLKSQVFRTRTEMEVSVLNDMKHPTPASKYWQSVREQNVMFHELVMLSYEYRKNLVEIQILKRDTKKEKDTLNKQLLQIDIERKEFIARNHERVAKDRIREIQQWSEIKEREAKRMTELELSGVDSHQLVSYTRRWVQQASLMSDQTPQGERQNLIGQLQSGLNACKRSGLMEQVYAGFDPRVKQFTSQYLLK